MREGANGSRKSGRPRRARGERKAGAARAPRVSQKALSYLFFLCSILADGPEARFAGARRRPRRHRHDGALGPPAVPCARRRAVGRCVGGGARGADVEGNTFRARFRRSRGPCLPGQSIRPLPRIVGRPRQLRAAAAQAPARPHRRGTTRCRANGDTSTPRFVSASHGAPASLRPAARSPPPAAPRARGRTAPPPPAGAAARPLRRPSRPPDRTR